MNFTGLVIILLLSGFTGWFTIWITLRMLLYPKTPRRFFGLTIQGIFPKNKQLVAETIARLVIKELFSMEKLEATVTSTGNLQKLRPEIDAHIDHFLRNKLKIVFPMLATLMGEKTIVQLKDAFLLEMDLLFPVLMKSYLHKLMPGEDLEKIIFQKVTALIREKSSGFPGGLIRKKMIFLEITGFVCGLIIGLIQIMVILLTL